MNRNRPILSWLFSLTTLGLYPAAAIAIDLGESIEIHGYGHAGALATTANKYLAADPSGTFDYYDFAVLMTGKLSPRTSVWAQFFLNGKTPGLDWAFLEYETTGGLILRVGQIKTPFGIYNETRDIEYLRPSSIQALMYHDRADLIEEAFRGIGLSSTHQFALGTLKTDLYGGQFATFKVGEPDYGPMLGVRGIWQPTDSTLTVALAAYDTGQVKVKTNEMGHSQFGAISIEFDLERARIKSELVMANRPEEKILSWYVQGDYTLTEHWSPFVRVESISFDEWNSSDLETSQKVLGIGMGYRFSDTWSARLETHFNHGYALPVESKALDPDDAKANWFLHAISLNFAF